MRFWLDVRSPGPTRAARVFDEVGGGLVGGVVVPGVICAALLRWRGTRAAATFLVAAVFSALLVQVLKHVVSRDRPAEILVGSDFGSYPSGHVAHAATMTVVVALVVRRPWVWWVAARYVGLMMASRMYLGAHWLTDTVAGGLLGAAVAYLIWRWMGERPSVVRPGAPPSPRPARHCAARIR